MPSISLFDLHAINLRACLNESNSNQPFIPIPAFEGCNLGDVVLCPLCLKPFTRRDLEEKRLSIEHIVPSGGSGENLTLTCTACNNKTGSALDSHLRKRIIFEENLHRDGGPVPILYKGGGGEQNAQLFFENDEECNLTWKIVGLPKQSNPKLQEKLVNSLIDPAYENAEMNIHFTLGYVHVLSQTAMLRSAYLAMFRKFGYSYILHPTLELVRQQIWQPLTGNGNAATVTHPHLLDAVSSAEGAGAFEKTEVGWLESPEEGFFVAPRLSNQLPYGYIVPMPKARENGDDFIKRLRPEDCIKNNESERKLEEKARLAYKIFDFPLSLLLDQRSCHFVRDL